MHKTTPFARGQPRATCMVLCTDLYIMLQLKPYDARRLGFTSASPSSTQQLQTLYRSYIARCQAQHETPQHPSRRSITTSMSLTYIILQALVSTSSRTYQILYITQMNKSKIATWREMSSKTHTLLRMDKFQTSSICQSEMFTMKR